VGAAYSKNYPDLIRAAFDPRWWNSPASVDGYNQMETNFSFVLGRGDHDVRIDADFG